MNERSEFEKLLRAVWPPVVFGVAFLALWELAVNVFDWKPYFLPKPSAIWGEFSDNVSGYLGRRRGLRVATPLFGLVDRHAARRRDGVPPDALPRCSTTW
ncbi:MAG: hypothetical protein WKF58_02550 [Ilumatobacteraceae bacterium]